jgi:polyhydroxyalkanoate synthesis regulator phasin
MGDRAPRSETVRDTLRRASKVVDAPLRKTEEAVRKIAERPNIDLMDAPHLAWEFLQKGRHQAEKAKGVLDGQLRKRLKDMGLATKEEMDALKRRISELEAAAGSKATAAPKPVAEETAEAPAGATAEAPTGATPLRRPKASGTRPATARPSTARPKAVPPRPNRARAKPTGSGTPES